jgi:hypothetical protein
MNNLKEVLSDYLYFGILFIIVLLIIGVFILLTNKKGKKKNIYLTGLLLKLDNKAILSLTFIIINFLLLAYTLLLKINLTLSFALISSLLIVLAFFLVKDAKNVLFNGAINGVNISLIYLANLINNLRLDNPDTLYLTLQIVMNFFGLIFFMFTSVKFVKNLRVKGDKNE